MGKFLLKRVIAMVITIFLVITLTFLLMHSIPGGPFTKEKKVPPAIEEALNKKYNLDDSLPKQYIDYLKRIAKLDLGPSFQYEGMTVNKLIKDGFPTSAKLGSFTVLLTLALGIPFGVLSALKQNKWPDYIVMFLATLGITIPAFVLATVFIYFFALKLGLLPTFGLDSWKGYILPVLALAGYSLSFITRLTRSSMLEVMQQDYIRTARAKGLPERVVIFKHGLRNSILPVVTYVGPMIAAILTGSFVIEKIFALPGMGRHFVQSITNRDYTTIMGITIFFATFLVFMVLIVDIVYLLVDPRIKLDD
ncbi:ABC transporter permease [Clostridium sp. D2Q-11]|uniref:ABC transporter permease n=1 Tax=Anaeromonas frigoriresistens TaxID=2683708 RepID=A0A942Z7J7_9FIRM|nr:ABC transporter permease [Anaeromonas frigoriresistens]MBS4536949.1 ABC transporter permease [Anaeromonas frigoriresistens]